MPKSTMGGSDPFHDLPKSEKDRIEKEMRKIAKEKFDQKKRKRRDFTKSSKYLKNNI